VDDLLGFIHGLRWIWVLGALGSSAWLVYELYLRVPATVPLGRPSPTPRPVNRVKPAAPVSANPLPASAASGLAEHRTRSAAQTVKMPSALPKEEASKATDKMPVAKKSNDADGEMEGLFSGLDAGIDTARADPKKPSTDSHARAARMEAAGLHQPSIHTDNTEPQPTANSPKPPSPLIQAVGQSPSMAKARSQTQELDDILKRIDKVLSDGPGTKPTEAPAAPVLAVPAAPIAAAPAAVVPAAQPEAPVPAPAVPAATPKPLWASAEIEDKDLDKPKGTEPRQEKLF